MDAAMQDDKKNVSDLMSPEWDKTATEEDLRDLFGLGGE